MADSPNIQDQAAHGKVSGAGLAFVYITLFLDMMGGSLLLPIVPYIIRQFNSDALSIGLLTAIYSAAAFASAPSLGWASDRWGRRPVLLISVFGSAIGYFIFGLGGALWVLFLSRLIDGLTGGNISTAMAYIADVTTSKNRTQYYAFSGVAFGLGFIMGPVIAGFLSGISLMAPAFAAGGMSLAGAIFGFFFLPESLPLEKRSREGFALEKANPFGVMVGIARLPNLSLLLMANFLAYLAFSSLFAYMAVFTLDRFHASAIDNASLFAVVGAVQMIGQGVIVYRLVPSFGEKWIAIFGLAIQVVAYSFFVVVPTFGWLFPLTVLGALGSAFCRPTLNALVANNVSDDQQGRAAGTIASLISLTNVIGPLLAGLAYDSISTFAPFIGGSILLAAACILIAGLKPTS